VVIRRRHPGNQLAAVTIARAVTDLAPATRLLAPLLTAWWVQHSHRVAARHGIPVVIDPLLLPDCIGMQIDACSQDLPTVCASLPELLSVSAPDGDELADFRIRVLAQLRGISSPLLRGLDALGGSDNHTSHTLTIGEQASAVQGCSAEDAFQHTRLLAAVASVISICHDRSAVLPEPPWSTRTREMIAVQPQSATPSVHAQATASAPAARTQTTGASPAAASAHVVARTAGVCLSSPDKPALHVAWSILGHGQGILDQYLRQRRALAYSIRAFSKEHAATGYGACVIGCAQDMVDEVTDHVRDALSMPGRYRPTESNLIAAKRRLRIQHHLALQTPRDIAIRACCYEIAGIDHRAMEEYVGALNEVSLDDIQRVVQEYLSDPRFARLTE